MQLSLSAFLQWKVNIFLCQKLGWHFTFFYIMMLGNIYFLVKRKEKNKIKRAVQMVFEKQKGRSEKRDIIRGVFKGILWHYYEKLFNVYSSIDKLKSFFNRHIKPDGIPVIEQELARGKGVLLITGHFGGIEYIPTFLAVRRYPITITVKFSSSHLRKISYNLANKLGFKIIDTQDCPNVFKAILQDLKENRIVITQCDEIEEWRPSFKEEVSFLGKYIYLDKTINTLIRRGDTSVVFAVMHRNENHIYRFIAHRREEILTSGKPLTNGSLGERILKLLEQYIYQYPEEWYQWKKVPDIKMSNDLVFHQKKIKSLPWLETAHEVTP